ncbi:extracellular solute-binding protein [Streptomyces sp. NBC_01515]|uniref:ABC transporter substrate-binding protein n=1 Tax=Streptomyces sp. NBC_01515 TaxID=2903890 RepID=UPI00386ADCCD
MSAARRPQTPSTSPGLTRRRLIASLGALPLAGAAAGCGTSEASTGGRVTIDFQWWGSGDRNLATEKAVALFEKRHPHIKVTTSFAGYSAYLQRLATQVAAGSGPDVLQMDFGYLRAYADRNVLSKLTDSVFSTISLKRIPTIYARTGLVDGTLYGLPTGIATQALLIDAKLWAKAGVGVPKPGWTWDDLLNDIGPALKKALPDRAPLTDFSGHIEIFQIWLVQHGKPLYRNDGSLGFTQADLLQFWEYMGRLRDKGVFTSPSLTASYASGSTADSPLIRKLSTGEFSITSSASSYFETYGAVQPISFPTQTAGSPIGMTGGASQALCVQRKCAHKAEAALLIDFLLNDPDAAKILGQVRGLPSNTQNLAALAPTLTGGDKAVYQFLTSIQSKLSPSPAPPPSGSDEDKLDFTSIYQDIIFGKKSLKSAAADMWDKFHTTVPGG